MLPESAPPKTYKIIKLFRVQSDKSIKNILNDIEKALNKFTDWSTIQKNSIIQQYFLQFPNQSIYKQGIRVSLKYGDKYVVWYRHQLLKNILNIGDENSIAYQYETSFVFSNPIPILKSIGFQQATRKHSNVTVYNSLKIGLQILIYHEKQDDSLQQFKKTVIQVVQTLSRPNFTNLLWKQVAKILLKSNKISEVQKNQINHQLMTIKKLPKIQTAS